MPFRAIDMLSGAPSLGATRMLSPHMNWVLIPKVVVSVGNSYHKGLMIGYPNWLA